MENGNLQNGQDNHKIEEVTGRQDEEKEVCIEKKKRDLSKDRGQVQVISLFFFFILFQYLVYIKWAPEWAK